MFFHDTDQNNNAETSCFVCAGLRDFNARSAFTETIANYEAEGSFSAILTVP